MVLTAKTKKGNQLVCRFLDKNNAILTIIPLLPTGAFVRVVGVKDSDSLTLLEVDDMRFMKGINLIEKLDYGSGIAFAPLTKPFVITHINMLGSGNQVLFQSFDEIEE